MTRKTYLALFLLFLGLSHLLCSAAIPATRSLLSLNEYSSFGVLQKQGWFDKGNKEKVFGEAKKEGLFEGRMDLESTLDYPGPGANKNHDPKTPDYCATYRASRRNGFADDDHGGLSH